MIGESKERVIDLLYRSMQEIAVLIHVADELQARLGTDDGNPASGMSYILRDIRERMAYQIDAFERAGNAEQSAAKVRRAC